MTSLHAGLRCVRCADVALAPTGAAGVLACRACGGEFCERAALESAVQQARQAGAGGSYARPVLSMTDPIRYVPCPVCKQLMVRRNFGGSSGVVVDVCGPHGVWFDHGELAQVLAFCASSRFARAEVTAAGRSQAQRFAASANPGTNGTDVVDLVGACVEVMATLIFD